MRIYQGFSMVSFAVTSSLVSSSPVRPSQDVKTSLQSNHTVPAPSTSACPNENVAAKCMTAVPDTLDTLIKATADIDENALFPWQSIVACTNERICVQVTQVYGLSGRKDATGVSGEEIAVGLDIMNRTRGNCQPCARLGTNFVVDYVGDLLEPPQSWGQIDIQPSSARPVCDAALDGISLWQRGYGCADDDVIDEPEANDTCRACSMIDSSAFEVGQNVEDMGIWQTVFNAGKIRDWIRTNPEVGLPWVDSPFRETPRSRDVDLLA